ncbi:MAG: hypothetical protein EPN21_00120 [Methylococcaceae bacterium]|nr:MAG: hypothetical protein EPN21_00120 [Methylococcaceae bacterium]
MSTLTLDIPDTLNAALKAASVRRQIPLSTLVREVLEKALVAEAPQPNAADHWLSHWYGKWPDMPKVTDGEARLAHLLKKHLS